MPIELAKERLCSRCVEVRAIIETLGPRLCGDNLNTLDSLWVHIHRGIAVVDFLHGAGSELLAKKASSFILGMSSGVCPNVRGGRSLNDPGAGAPYHLPPTYPHILTSALASMGPQISKSWCFLAEGSNSTSSTTPHGCPRVIAHQIRLTRDEPVCISSDGVDVWPHCACARRLPCSVRPS